MTDHRNTLDRKSVKCALRGIGMSARQIDALLRDGWKGLVGASRAEAEELRDALDALNASLIVDRDRGTLDMTSQARIERRRPESDPK